jgi:glycosyltransferase involved in cell wall biosynthesis
MNNPLISVITVVYNGVTTLEQTILSVINQAYKNIEYIIIDGGSTDGTVDIIKKYEKHLAYWISEPDNGIYDAMNKGIDKATGEWINFMNSGDYFHNKYVLLFINSHLSNNIDVLYGDTMLKDSKHKSKIYPLWRFKLHMPFCHQSCFVKTNLYKRIYFDVAHKYCADYNFFYSLYIAKYKFAYLPSIIAIYDENGISSTNHRNCIIEYAKIRGDIHSFKFQIYFFIMTCYLHIKNVYKQSRYLC